MESTGGGPTDTDVKRLCTPAGDWHVSWYAASAVSGPVVCEPLLCAEEIPGPAMVHEVTFRAAHVMVACPPYATLSGELLRDRTGSGMTVIGAAAVTVPSGVVQESV